MFLSNAKRTKSAVGTKTPCVFYQVRRVLEAVGLADIPLAGLLTPDTR